MEKNYTLNDLEYDNVPLRVMIPNETPECDKRKLQESIEKNRRLINHMRSNKKYKELVE